MRRPASYSDTMRLWNTLSWRSTTNISVYSVYKSSTFHTHTHTSHAHALCFFFLQLIKFIFCCRELLSHQCDAMKWKMKCRWREMCFFYCFLRSSHTICDTKSNMVVNEFRVPLYHCCCYFIIITELCTGSARATADEDFSHVTLRQTRQRERESWTWLLLFFMKRCILRNGFHSVVVATTSDGAVVVAIAFTLLAQLTADSGSEHQLLCEGGIVPFNPAARIVTRVLDSQSSRSLGPFSLFTFTRLSPTHNALKWYHNSRNSTSNSRITMRYRKCHRHR